MRGRWAKSKFASAKASPPLVQSRHRLFLFGLLLPCSSPHRHFAARRPKDSFLFRALSINSWTLNPSSDLPHFTRNTSRNLYPDNPILVLLHLSLSLCLSLHMEDSNANAASAAAAMPPANFSGGVYGRRELPEPDVWILTSGALRIPAHSGILASVSPVLENIIDQPRKHRSSERVIPILGVPCDAVSAFVGFLYSSRCTEEQMEKYGIHLLALSHVYLVPQLKQRCTRALIRQLTIENVVDVLQLARLCDAPDLYLKCLKLFHGHFKSVEATEGWKFLQNHDPWLELEILQFIDEAESRKKKGRRNKEDQSLYLELSEAMECLEHICTEGCTSVGPCDAEPVMKKEPCGKFTICCGIQLSIKHFATCEKRVGGGCSRCKRMWQLLRLHSSICDQPDSCRVPLCRQFKLRMHQEKRKDDARWKLLAKKVISAKVLSSLSQPKRKRAEELREEVSDRGIRSMRLSPIASH